jgi:hypothetical protein
MLCGNISIELTGPGAVAGDGCRNTIQNFIKCSTIRTYAGHLNGYVNSGRNKTDGLLHIYTSQEQRCLGRHKVYRAEYCGTFAYSDVNISPWPVTEFSLRKEVIRSIGLSEILI